MKQSVVGNFELVLASIYGVSEAAFKASPDEFANTTVSSSPYEVVEFVPNSHLTLQLREDYWDAGNENPALQNNVKTVTYTVIKETSQAQIALETGNVDCFEGLASSLVPTFSGNPAYGNIVAPSGNGWQMYFSGDASRPCGRSEDLCKAIAYAIDMDGVVTAAFEGLATDNFLYQFIVCGRNTQRARFARVVFLGDVFAPCRVRLVRMVFETGDDALNAPHRHVIEGHSIRARRHTALGFGNILVGQQIELGIVEIAVEPLKHISLLVCFFFQTFQYSNRISHDVSHTFLHFVLKDKLLPFALWTAFPSSDYYGSSVTVADIQSRVSHGAHSRK